VEEKYFWHVLGILLGWTLTTLGSRFRDNLNDRKAIARLMTKLFRMDALIKKMEEAIKPAAASPQDPQAFDDLKKTFSNSLDLELESLLKDFKASADEISELYPFLTMELEVFSATLQNTKKAVSRFAETNKVDRTETDLSALERDLLALRETFTVTLKKTSRKYGALFSLKLFHFKKKHYRSYIEKKASLQD